MENVDSLFNKEKLFLLEVNSWLVRFQTIFARKNNNQLTKKELLFVLQILEHKEIINAFPETEKRNFCSLIINISEALKDAEKQYYFMTHILKKRKAIACLSTDIIAKQILKILNSLFSKPSSKKDCMSFIIQILECQEIINFFTEDEKTNFSRFIVFFLENTQEKIELYKFIIQILKNQDSIVSFPTNMKLLIVKQILEILKNISNDKEFVLLGDLFFAEKTLEKFDYSSKKSTPIVDAGDMGLVRSKYYGLNALESAKKFHEEIKHRKN